MNDTLNFKEFLSTDRVSDERKIDILKNCIQSVLDANWPGLKLERLSDEHIESLTVYFSHNYNFKFVNTDQALHVFAEPLIII